MGRIPRGEATKHERGRGNALRSRRQRKRDRLRLRARTLRNRLVGGDTLRDASVPLVAGAMALGLIGNTVPEQVLPRSAAELVAGWSYDLEVSNNPRFSRQPAIFQSASPELLKAMAQEEGMRLTVYRDVAGYPTVGIGHLVRPQDGLRVGDRITRAQALEFLRADIRTAEEAVTRLVGNLPLYQREYDALVDLVFNVGEGGADAQDSPRLNAAIAAGDYDGIAQELTYTTADGAVAGGLVHRSERRANIFVDGNYANPRLVNS